MLTPIFGKDFFFVILNKKIKNKNKIKKCQVGYHKKLLLFYFKHFIDNQYFVALGEQMIYSQVQLSSDLRYVLCMDWNLPMVLNTVSVLGRDKGLTVKYNPLPEGVPEGKALGNS